MQKKIEIVMKICFLKYIIMIIAAICALICFIYAVMRNEITIAFISLVSSFIPIVVWFIDTIENNKTVRNLKKKLEDLDDCMTWK